MVDLGLVVRVWLMKFHRVTVPDGGSRSCRESLADEIQQGHSVTDGGSRSCRESLVDEIPQGHSATV